MGEEEKKPEDPKSEQNKPASGEKKKPESDSAPAEKKDGKKGDEAKEAPPPTEVVLKVFMHCEGCARKVRRCLAGFDGVEDVITDCKSSTVVVKGEKAAADPVKVLNRVQRKSHRQVELISPIPAPPPKEEDKPKQEDPPKPEEPKQEPQVITVVLKVHMHCDACALEIKKRIQKMKGVESAEPDLKNSEVAVKGVFEPAKLVQHVYKRTGKHAVIVSPAPEPEKKEGGGEKPKEESAAPKEEEEQSKEKKEGEAKTEDGGGGGEEGKEETEETKVVEMKRSEFQYYPPRYGMELYAYPPQIFSDENPNACSVM